LRDGLRLVWASGLTVRGPSDFAGLESESEAELAALGLCRIITFALAFAF